jgi:hypothetical protein
MGSLDFQLSALASGGIRAGGTVTQTSDADWAKDMFAGVGASMSLQNINGEVTVSFLPGITLRNQAAQDAESKAIQAQMAAQAPQPAPAASQPQPQQPQYTTAPQAPQNPSFSYPYGSSGIQPNGGSGDTGAASDDPTDNGPSYNHAPSYSNEGAPSYSSGGIQSNGGSGDTGAAGDDPTDNG